MAKVVTMNDPIVCTATEIEFCKYTRKKSGEQQTNTKRALPRQRTPNSVCVWWICVVWKHLHYAQKKNVTIPAFARFYLFEHNFDPTNIEHSNTPLECSNQRTQHRVKQLQSMWFSSFLRSNKQTTQLQSFGAFWLISGGANVELFYPTLMS